MNRAETGQRGEAAAAKFYLNQGCRLLAHNFRTRMGELDLVVQEPDGTVVICEVKTRAPDSMTTPAEAVDVHKQRRLIRAAQAYLQQKELSDIRLSGIYASQYAGGYKNWHAENVDTTLEALSELGCAAQDCT